MIERLPTRLREKIEVQPDGCWRWTACVTSTGYGRVWTGRRVDWAHRVVYRLLVGPIPEGLVLDHLCRFRACVNPTHVEPVTDRINTIRGDAPDATRRRHRAKRFCLRGHPLFGANVRRYRGSRHCRACRVIHVETYHARLSERAHGPQIVLAADLVDDDGMPTEWNTAGLAEAAEQYAYRGRRG